MRHTLNSIHLEVAIIIKEMATPYIVGGAVRDSLLKKESNDIDWVSDAPVGELKQLFAEADWDIKEVGESFNVLFVSKLGYTFEIAQFRKDVKCDGRHAVVEHGTIINDANRRDFTCNALYYDVFADEIVDPTNMGLQDITNGILRFVGKPIKRIEEDYLRVFRFYRFLKKTGFNPHPASMRACRQMFNEAYSKSTPERVRIELEKMVG